MTATSVAMSALLQDVAALREKFEKERKELERLRGEKRRHEATKAEDAERLSQLTAENATLRDGLRVRRERLRHDVDLDAELTAARRQRLRLAEDVRKLTTEGAAQRQAAAQEIEKLRATVALQKRQLESVQTKCKEEETRFQNHLSLLEQNYAGKLKEMTAERDEAEARRRQLEATLEKERQDRAVASYNRSLNPESNAALKSRILQLKTDLAKVQKERDALQARQGLH